uniref:Uncharacterized protein n=1 Tax=Panagrolaimus sp. JU765 TaxID=591449 RepID=A0AC34RG14_9BILA
MPIVRLIALQSQICNGLKTPTWQYYRRLIVQSYGITELSWLLKLQMAGLIRCSDNTDKIKMTYLPIDFETLKKRFRLIVDDPESETVAKTYSGYVPLLIRILEEGETNQFKDWKSLEVVNEEKKPTLTGKKMLFVVGGITRAEMGLIKTRFPSFIHCCTSTIITGDSMLQVFREIS